MSNVRIRRTQKLLREALIELIEEQNFEALTVGVVCERAMVSRAAFYRNYKDKYDLVEQIFTEAMQALLEAISTPGKEHPPQVWVKFFEHIEKYERLYGALLGRKGSPWFVLKMRASLVELIEQLTRTQSAQRRPYPTTDDFIPDLMATMFVEAITWWLERRRPYTPQEFAQRCALLSTAIFNETSTWN